ncbi:MAG TPA: hypothetical protein VNO50_10935 [Pyrinomonadaceae bacterium]|nr:hypothetical protein [Pyrinomonadaceae bacterium]
MTSSQIAALIQLGARLDKQIADKTSDLNEIKAKVRAHAENAVRKREGIPQDQPVAGQQWEGEGTDGVFCQVSFPEDKLVSPIVFIGDVANRYEDKKLVPLGADIKKLAGDKFDNLFAPLYRPAKAFRDLVPLLLPKADRQPLLEAMSEPSSPRVSFKLKKSE